MLDIGTFDPILSRQKLHVRLQKRNGRKSITTISGLESDLDEKRILKALKKRYQCLGSLDVDDSGTVVALRLSGDQRENVKTFFLEERIIGNIDDILIHGG